MVEGSRSKAYRSSTTKELKALIFPEKAQKHAVAAKRKVRKQRKRAKAEVQIAKIAGNMRKKYAGVQKSTAMVEVFSGVLPSIFTDSKSLL